MGRRCKNFDRYHSHFRKQQKQVPLGSADFRESLELRFGRTLKFREPGRPEKGNVPIVFKDKRVLAIFSAQYVHKLRNDIL